MKISRWPQYMSVAAVIFLALGLAGIIYKVVLPHNKPGGFVMGPTGDGTGPGDDREGIATTRPESLEKLKSDLASASAVPPMASGGAATPLTAGEQAIAGLSSVDAAKIERQAQDATPPARERRMNRS